MNFRRLLPARPPAAHDVSRFQRLGTVIAIVGAGALAACGGGGGGGSNTSTADPSEVYDLNAAMTQAYAANAGTQLRIAGLQATSGSRSFSMTFTLAPGSDLGTTTDGRTIKQVAQTAEVVEAGVTGTRSLGSVTAYANGPFQPLLTVGGNVYTRYATLQASLPSAAVPGSGVTPLVSGVVYSDAALTQAIGTANVHWTLERVDSTHALLCLKTISTVNTVMSETEDCLEIDRANGNRVSGARLKVNGLIDGLNLTFR